jgi:DNA-binding transcriptional LysR family regulator
MNEGDRPRPLAKPMAKLGAAEPDASSKSARRARGARAGEGRRPGAIAANPYAPSGRQMDWDKLRVFHAVAEAGSFTHAGETLNLSQSAVSRQISGLEESLSVPLFHRHARGLILTEQGELLFHTAKEIFGKLAMAEAMLSENRESPRGPLKITTTMAFGSNWLTPRMNDFVERYPEIAVTLIFDDNELDLSMRQADVAIRMSPPRQPDLVQRHLVTVNFHIYAARSYVDRRGTPATLADLSGHRLIVYGDSPHPPFPQVNWLANLATAAGGALKIPVMNVNNYQAIFRAVESGIGLAALPDFMAREEADMVRILPEVEGPKVQAYFLYPEELRHSKRIAVLRDFLLQKVSQTQF